jgi:tRNA pseudouridine-54 N-methylase
VHLKYILIYIQQDATLHSLFIAGNSTHHQERIQLSTASGICHTVTAICRYRGRAGTGLSVLYVTHTIQPDAHTHIKLHGVTYRKTVILTKISIFQSLLYCSFDERSQNFAKEESDARRIQPTLQYTERRRAVSVDRSCSIIQPSLWTKRKSPLQ